MLQIIASGLAMGCVYGLIGLGFILIYNATHGLNFAHGDLAMLGAYLFYSLSQTTLPLWLAAVAALCLMGLLGIVYESILFQPLRRRPFIMFVIATIGCSIFLRNFALLVWGPNPLKVASFFSMSSLRVGSVALRPESIFIVIATALALASQYVLFFQTDFGRRIRAAAQNPEMAALLGIRLGRMTKATFVVSTLLAGIAGVLIAPIFLVDTDMGSGLILKAFIAVIIGGFGSLPGAVLGGLIVGVLDILVAVFVSTTFKDAISFGILILLLLVFPRGLFGGPLEDRV